MTTQEAPNTPTEAPIPPPEAPAIYLYDARSKLFAGVGQADPDPMQPGEFLLPAFSTLTAPPTTVPGQATIFADDAWQLLPDHRGLWFNAQGQALQIDDVKADVAALTRTAPPSPDHVLVAGQWQLSQARVDARFKAAKDSLLAQARSQREVVLNRLMGISFAAKEAGNTATVAACMTARQALLDLTKHATITGATTEAQLKAAYKAIYGGIVAATPADIRSVYSDVQV